jgi:hypothetical protein
VLWAHRGLGHARESIGYRTGNLGRTSGPSLLVMRLLESHVILGVMLRGLSIVHEEIKEKVNRSKRDSRPSEMRNRDITPPLMGVLPRTQASPLTLSSNSVLPSSIADGEGGVP